MLFSKANNTSRYDIDSLKKTLSAKLTKIYTNNVLILAPQQINRMAKNTLLKFIAFILLLACVNIFEACKSKKINRCNDCPNFQKH